MGDLLGKKKIKVALVGLILWAAARFGLELDPGAVDRIIELAMVVVAAIGLEDLGKARVTEAAKTGGSIASVEVTTTTIPPPIAPTVPPAGQAKVRSTESTTIPGLGQAARRLREEARTRTTTPPSTPVTPPPKRSG